MRKTLIAASAALTLGVAGCQSIDRETAIGAGVGGLGGAAIGAGITGDAEGALIGGAIGAAAGAVAGNVIGESNDGRCVYEDRYGREFIADCPAGY